MMPPGLSVKAIGTALFATLVALTGIIAGISVEGFLALILAANGIELGFIFHNTARISTLQGRYDAEHD